MLHAKLAHVVFRTRHFEEMIRWYEKVFEAKVQHRDEKLAFLTYDDEHHRFAFLNLKAVLPPDAAASEKRDPQGLDHVAYTLPDVDALLDQYARLKQQEIVPFWCVHHGITMSLYYRDPEGNGVEFQVDRFEKPELANDYIRGPAFSENPIGVAFDPDELLKRRAAGEAAHSLLEPPEGEPLRI